MPEEFVLNRFLPYQVAALSTRFSRAFSTAYREKYGITVPEWRIVAHLSQAEGPLSVREIHAQVHMEKSRVSRATARLERRGYVEKTKNDRDRRLVELRLSQAGRDMVRDLTPAAEAFEQSILAPLGERAADFRAALDTLLNQGGISE